jgi:hypothetical protein
MKTRPVIVIVITLILGFVLGMLTSAQIRNHKLKTVRVFFSEEKFREGLYHTIEPTEEQKVKIQKILDKYSALNIEQLTNLRKNFETNMDNMRKELDSILTKEQLTSLKEMDERRMEMIRKARNSRPDSDNFRNDRMRFPDGRPDSSDFRNGEMHFPDGRPPMPHPHN